MHEVVEEVRGTMRAYRLGWTVVAVVLAVAGGVVGAFTSPATLLVAFTFFAVAAGTAVLAATPTEARPDRARAYRRALVGAGIAGSAGAAVVGWTSLVGPAAFLVAVVVSATSPWVARSIRRWLGAIPTPPDDRVDVVIRALACSSPGIIPYQHVPAPAPTTDEQLCDAWCASLEALTTTYSGAKFLRIVEQRGEYLDELERRNPGGFSAWLASGATAGDNPLPYLSIARVDATVINWDDLLEGRD